MQCLEGLLKWLIGKDNDEKKLTRKVRKEDTQ